MEKVRFVSVIWIILIVSNIYAATPQKHLIHRPASSEHIKPFSKATHQTRTKEYAINNIASETFSDNIEPIQTGLNIIDISSNITTNTIWTSDNIYHVLNAIDVNGAMLVIEPGTTVTFAGGGSSAGIKVLNGGTLIARGTPDSPILFTSDSSSPYYEDYLYAAYIEETASTATQFTYCIVEWAYAGIALFNIDLDTNIENNYFMACVWGITEYGTRHTDIINNLCFGSGYCGIYVNMKSLSDVSDADSIIKIQNNTCDYYQECGIIVYGADDFDTAGSVELKNNIVSEASDYGISLWDCLYITANNNGYYNNYSNTNSFPEYDPVEVFEMPYVYGAGDYDICYLNQNCAFIDGGLHYVEETALIGKTTAVDGTPDSNKIDIGFHYPNWDYSNAGSTTLAADFDNNYKVDYNDLALFADYWLFDYDEAYEVLYWDYEPDGRIDFMDLAYLLDYWPDYFNFEDFADFAQQWRKEVDERLYDGRPDLNKDGVVNFGDFVILAGEWGMTCEPNTMEITLEPEPNLVSNVLWVTIENVSDNIKYHLCMDGQYLGRFYGGEIAIPTYKYLNGLHELKVIGFDLEKGILIAPVINIMVNNRLQGLTGSDTYKYNQAYRIGGLYEPNNGSTINFTIRDLEENVIWTDSSTGHFNFIVPAGILQSPYNYLTIQEATGTKSGYVEIESSKSSGLEDWIIEIVKEFDISSEPNLLNAKSLLVGVKKGYGIKTYRIGDWTYERKEVWKEYLNACKKRSLSPTICLFFNQATRANIQTAFRIQGVEAIYIISDGNRKVGDADRTFFEAWDGEYFSYLRRNWTGNPEDYVDLGSYESGYSVTDSINYFNAKNRLHVFQDCCKNGPICMPNSFYTQTMFVSPAQDNNWNQADYDRTIDMANAYGINTGSVKRSYMSWRGYAFGSILHYNTFLKALWTELGKKDTYKEAFFDAAHADYGCYVPAQNFSHVGDLTDEFIP